eukprot:848151-Prorocentrum_minimum.AAC.1
MSIWLESRARQRSNSGPKMYLLVLRAQDLALRERLRRHPLPRLLLLLGPPGGPSCPRLQDVP